MTGTSRPRIALRELQAKDLNAAHALSLAVGWSHRLADWKSLLRVGAGVVAMDGDELVATSMYWLYGDETASLGMVIVAPRLQGAGIGRQMMNAVLERIGARRVVLNATDEGLTLYRSLGFEGFGQILQHQGAAFSVPLAPLRRNERVRPMGEKDYAAVVDLDRRATGMKRDTIIESLLQRAHGVVLDRGGEPAGFALLRRFGHEYLIGPAAAPAADGAKSLISWWLGTHASAFCRVDTPEDSGLSGWLDSLGLPCVGRVTRMARGGAPTTDPIMRPFAIANQALG